MQNRDTVRSTNIETTKKLVVTSDNPLSELNPNHPDYDKFIATDSSILTGNSGFATIEQLINSVPANNPVTVVPPPPTAPGFTLPTPTGLFVDTSVGQFGQKITSDGSVIDNVYVTFNDVPGASSYEIGFV
jgi:hypothetical protein